MSDFDDRSGIVACETPWGRWWQTIDDVTVEVQVATGTRAKDVRCTIRPSFIALSIAGTTVFEGELAGPVQPGDSVWTLEDKRLLRVFLVKVDKTAGNCWPSLLVNQFEANFFTKDEMEKKLTLQRFQLENPGMDFSGASISGNYQGGGPQLPE